MSNVSSYSQDQGDVVGPGVLCEDYGADGLVGDMKSSGEDGALVVVATRICKCYLTYLMGQGGN